MKIQLRGVPAVLLCTALLIFTAVIETPTAGKAESSPLTTELSGTLTSNTSWNASQPYYLSSNLTIPAGITLTLEPGTVVEMGYYCRLDVQGTLLVNGTASQPVTFKSSQPSPKAGDWASIWIHGSADATIDHCKVSHAVYGIWSVDTAPSISNTTVSKCRNYGMYLQGSRAVVKDSVVKSCEDSGIYLSGSHASIYDSDVSGNTRNGFRIYDGRNTLDGVTISSTITAIDHKSGGSTFSDMSIESCSYGYVGDGLKNSYFNASSMTGITYAFQFEDSINTYVNDCTISKGRGVINGHNAFCILNTVSTSNMYSETVTSSSGSRIVLEDASLANPQFSCSDTSVISIRNSVRAKISGYSDENVDGANVTVKDNGVVVYDGQTAPSGMTPWTMVTDRQYKGSNSPTENATAIEVDVGGMSFPNNPRDVDMSHAHTEYFNAGNSAPIVDISSPDDGEKVENIVNVTGTAGDADGKVSQVLVRVGYSSWAEAQLVGSGASVGWYYLWDSRTHSAASASIEAMSVDDEKDTSAISMVSVWVEHPENDPPVVIVTEPVEGATVSDSFHITGTATDTDGVERVEVNIDDTRWENATLNGEDWKFWWYTQNIPNGEYVILVRAKDGLGAFSGTVRVNVTVWNVEQGNLPPALNITSPGELDFLQGKVTVQGFAWDVDGNVTEVNYAVDDDEWYSLEVEPNSTVPWEFALKSREYPNGYHDISLIAFDDVNASSDVTTVKVYFDNEGNKAPLITFVSPMNGDTVAGLATFTGTAEDPDGTVQSVSWKLDGREEQPASYDAGTGVWTFELDTTLYTDGIHQIWINASDGKLDSWLDIAVYFSNDNFPDVILGIVSPVNGSVVGKTFVMLGYTYSLDPLVTQVDYRLDDSLWAITEALTSIWSSWSKDINMGGMEPGYHTLDVRATYAKGTVYDSVTVYYNPEPVVPDGGDGEDGGEDGEDGIDGGEDGVDGDDGDDGGEEDGTDGGDGGDGGDDGDDTDYRAIFGTIIVVLLVVIALMVVVIKGYVRKDKEEDGEKKGKAVAKRVGKGKKEAQGKKEVVKGAEGKGGKTEVKKEKVVDDHKKGKVEEEL